MRRVTMPVEDVFSHRPRQIGEMLSALKGSIVACQPHTGMVQRGKVLAAHDGGTLPESDFHRWRFRSASRDIECQYFELWRFFGDERTAYLDKAYLHVFEIDRRRHVADKIVSVHAETQADSEGDFEQYKQALHLHVDKAAQPVPKCHFPLTISHLDKHADQVLSSVENLTSALAKTVSVMRIEVVSRYA
jgi:hypothetical protein